MKVQLGIKKIERIDKLIKGYEDYTIAHEGGGQGLFGFMHRNGNSRAFTRVYEIYTIKGAKDFATTLSGLSKWLESDVLYVRLFFDYPNGRGQFKCRNEYLGKLLILIPGLQEVIGG